MYRLREIYIKDFRGFREERIEFPEADMILLIGNNGTGKTSFFDALEWGFTGSLKRYESQKQRGNREVFLTNMYGSNGLVEIKLEREDKTNILIRRESQLTRKNDFNPGKLFINGEKDKNISELFVRDYPEKDFDFSSAFNFSHLLGQELINSFIRSYNRPERYTGLSNLTGAQSFSIYHDNLVLLRQSCEKKILDLNKRVKKYRIQIEKMKELIDKLQEVEKRVAVLICNLTEKTITPYKELANQIYRKINPHSFFDTIDWERDSTDANNPTLVLKLKSKDGQQVNPSYIYSTGQINLILLSLFLSFAVQNNWSNLNCFFMDDPLQNMDYINIFSFVDVLRSILLNNPQAPQLFISTHDQKIYSFLKKKFRMLNVCTLEFKSCGKNGPELEIY